MNMMNTGIYAIKNLVNGKMYIGSACNFRSRFSTHKHRLSNGIHNNLRLQSSWNKHGSENFVFEKLLVCKKDDLIFYEQRCLDVYDSVKSGYNIRLIAESNLGLKSSIETRAKVSAAGMGRYRSPEAIAKTIAHTKGIPRSQEVRSKISESLKGKKLSPESIAKGIATRAISHAADKLNGTVRIVSQETKEKLSAFNTGKIMPNETKEKISSALKGRKKSPESIAKRTASRVGFKNSTESIAKRKATMAAKKSAKLSMTATRAA